MPVPSVGGVPSVYGEAREGKRDGSSQVLAGRTGLALGTGPHAHGTHHERKPPMATITVPGTDVTPGQVSQALRGGLGPRYHVLPGTQASYLFAAPRPDQPDVIVVAPA